MDNVKVVHELYTVLVDGMDCWLHACIIQMLNGEWLGNHTDILCYEGAPPSNTTSWTWSWRIPVVEKDDMV